MRASRLRQLPVLASRLRRAGSLAGLPVNADFGMFYRDFEWMGLQRHLKVLGIFARLHYRDGKSGYLEDTPRFAGYVRAVATRYGDLRPLLRLFVSREECDGRSRS